ncbi:MAG: transposase [Thermoplasmatales archaeon]
MSPPIPNVLSGGNKRFSLRLMPLIFSLKMLGLSYEKIGSLLKLLFCLDVTEPAMVHSVMSVSSAFGPRYDELREEMRKEASLHSDETSWRIKGRNHWLWVFLGRWSVIYEVAKSRGKDVPKMVLGKDYKGIVISDSWSAWNHVAKAHKRCLVHYLREIKGTSKSPVRSIPFAKKFKRVLRD